MDSKCTENKCSTSFLEQSAPNCGQLRDARGPEVGRDGKRAHCSSEDGIPGEGVEIVKGGTAGNDCGSGGGQGRVSKKAKKILKKRGQACGILHVEELQVLRQEGISTDGEMPDPPLPFPFPFPSSSPCLLLTLPTRRTHICKCRPMHHDQPSPE